MSGSPAATFGPVVVDPSNPDRDPHGPNVRNAEVDSPLYQQWVDETRRARGENV